MSVERLFDQMSRISASKEASMALSKHGQLTQRRLQEVLGYNPAGRAWLEGKK